MAKGNHVFNNFDSTVHNAFKAVTTMLGQGREFDAMAGSGGDKVKALEVLHGKYGGSYAVYQEIMGHPTIKVLHELQDDEPVDANNQNSLDFGERAVAFHESVIAWAFGTDDVNPGETWRHLVNAGFDKTARDNYVKKGSSAPGTPASPDKRLARCTEVHGFIKGELTGLVMAWLDRLRQDLHLTRVVDYGKKPEEWKAILGAAKTEMV